MRRWVLAALVVFSSVFVVAQTSTPLVSIPHIVRYAGTVPLSLPASISQVEVVFQLFAAETGGRPLWQESQTIAVHDGRFEALIGSATMGGVPESWFAFGQARWLQVQVGDEPQTKRVLLASVPYALEAQNAQTLGGLPASAFVLREGYPPTAPEVTMATTGYATLGSNTFTGSETVTGNVTVGGTLSSAYYTLTSAAVVPQLLYVNSTSLTGSLVASRSQIASTAGTALYGYAIATTGGTTGVAGRTDSSGGLGVYGLAAASSGATEGVSGRTMSNIGHGVAGYAMSGTGNSIAVYGKSISTQGTAVMGESSPANGIYPTYAVVGKAHGTTGLAVWGTADATTGATVGVQGSVASLSGTAGVFGNAAGGNILIGQSGPKRVFRVDGTGKVYADGGTVTSGADFAESIAVRESKTHYEPGDVLMLDEEADRRVTLANEPYSTRVAGIYSTKPGTLSTTHSINAVMPTDEIPMAVVGIVPCKVTTVNGAIHRGDLLVASSVPGRAMKATDRSLMPGAIVGKAMQELREGDGVIEVLVTLE